jgi:hypothetical protein
LVLAFVTVAVTEYNSLKIEISGLKKELGGTRERLAKLEANISVALLSEKIKRTIDDRMPQGANAPSTASFALSRDEVQVIRDFIKVPPPLPGTVQTMNVGDHLPEAVLAPLPEPIMEKVPKLRGARYTVDRNSAIIVAAPSTDRVDVIINPF